MLFYIDGKLSSNLSLTPSKWTHNYVNIWFTSIAYQNQPDDSKLPSTVQSSYVSYYQKDYVSLVPSRSPCVRSIINGYAH